jgi:soluble P-type ATPase
VPLTFAIPGRPLELAHVLFDLNGTLTDRGRLIAGVPERLERLREHVTVRLLSADTFGTLPETAATLGLEPRRIVDGDDKRRFVEELGPSTCAAVGNGLNDVPMLEIAALAITVTGPEGASARALAAADVVCCSIVDALDLLLDERALVATLRP